MGITLGGLLVILIFTLLGFFRGLLRFAAAFGALAVGGLLARPLSLPGQWIAGTFVPRALVPTAGALISGLVIFLVLYGVAEHFIRKRERERRDGGRLPMELWEAYLGSVLGAAWGFVLVLLVLTGVETVTTVQAAMEEASVEIAWRAEERRELEMARAPRPGQPRRQELRPPPPPAEVKGPPPGSLAAQVRESIFAPIVRHTNPMEGKPRKMLRDLTVVVGDPVLFDRFQGNPQVSGLMQHPDIVALSNDTEVQRLIREQDYRGLLDHPLVAAAAQDPELQAKLKQADLASILEGVRREPVKREAFFR